MWPKVPPVTILNNISVASSSIWSDLLSGITQIDVIEPVEKNIKIHIYIIYSERTKGWEREEREGQRWRYTVRERKGERERKERGKERMTGGEREERGERERERMKSCKKRTRKTAKYEKEH